jgi:WD40 repeat protein
VLRSYERVADDSGGWVELGRGRVQAITRHLAISPDGATVLAGDDVGRIYAIDRRMRPLTLPSDGFVGHQQRITDLSFSPDGALVASTSIDGTARLWRPEDGTPVAVLPSERHVESCEFTPDGRFLLTVHIGGRQKAVTRRWFLDAAELAAAARATVQPWTRIERVRFAGLLGGDGEGEPRAAAGG